MKLIAGVVCFALVATFIDVTQSSVVADDWEDSYDDNFEDALSDFPLEEELQGEDRFFGSVLAATQNAAKSAAGAAKSAASTAAGAAKSAASTAASASRSAVNLAKDTTIGAVNLAKDTTIGAAKTCVKAAQFLTEKSTGIGLDFLLANVKLMLAATGKENIVLPEIDTKFTGVSFKTSEGYFRTLKNLTRSGKTNVTMDGMALVLSVPMKVQGIEVGYHNFTAKALFLSTQGDFQVNIEKNLIHITLRIRPGLTCQLNVDKIEVPVLDGISLKFNGLCKMCATMVEKAGTALANYLKETIRAKVESAMNDAISDAVKNNPVVCSKFFGS